MTVVLVLGLALCVGLLIWERRRTKMLLARLDTVLLSGTADVLADEHLTPTERRLLSRMRTLETREEKVRRGYENISSLVADIAHQSKTPLSSILMYAELHDCGILRTQTERLQFLIDSLTKLAACESGLIAENLHPKQNAVRELIRTAVEAQYARADAKQMTLLCDIPDGLTAVFDMRWTGEAVGNILDNAIKYASAGTRISISAHEYELFVRIDIADTGMGIPEEALCHIWKRFYRGANTDGGGGVGIGLYLTQEILHTEGGRCAVSSRVGEGSVFSVFLPKS